MARNYYFLVAGLPDISLEDGKLSFSLQSFSDEIKEFINPADFELIELMFLKRDNANLLNMLQKNDLPFQPGGKYSQEMLEEEIKEPKLLPSYMREFIEAYQEEKKIAENVSWENQLATLYYNHLLTAKNGFMREWFELELNIKNILTALTCRKYNLPLAKEIIGNNEVAEALKTNTANDFGLSGELEYLDTLSRAFAGNNLAERERKIDTLKMEILEVNTFFHYFSIEQIIAFLLKLAMIERWLILDRKTGEEMFKTLVKKLETSYEFPEEFRQ